MSPASYTYDYGTHHLGMNNKISDMAVAARDATIPDMNLFYKKGE